VAALALPPTGRSYAVLGMVATGYAVTAGLYASTIHRGSRVRAA
jgi:DMSO reductase anchor subunit